MAESKIKVLPLENNNSFVTDISTGFWIVKKKSESLISENPEKIFSEIYGKVPPKPLSYDPSLKEIIISVTDSCNLNCLYCARSYSRPLNRSMDKETLMKVLQRAIDFSKSQDRKIYIQFHGGEPTLRTSTIREALESFPKDELATHLNLRIQTNATLINESFISLVSNFNIQTGISIDGPPEVNDRARIFANGKGTSELILKNLQKVRSGAPNVKITSLSVLSRTNIDDAKHLYNYIESLGISDITLIPSFVEGSAETIGKDIMPEPEEFVKPSIEIFDSWTESLKNGRMTRNSLDYTYLWNLASADAYIPQGPTNCGAGVFSIFVETDGNVYPCSSAAFHELRMGNISYDSLDEIMNSDVASTFRSRTTPNVEECDECALQHICRGGCPASALRSTGSMFKKDPYCVYWYPFISHVVNKVAEDPTLIKLAPSVGIVKK